MPQQHRLRPGLKAVLQPLVGQRFDYYDDLELAVLTQWNALPDVFGEFSGETFRIAIEQGTEAGWIVAGADGKGYMIVIPNQDDASPASKNQPQQPDTSHTHTTLSPALISPLHHLVALSKSGYVIKTPENENDYRQLVESGLVAVVYQLTEDGKRFVGSGK